MIKSISATGSVRGITQKQVCQSLGILPRKLRRWMQMGLVRPSLQNSPGGKLANGQPNWNIFSKTDWTEIKTIVFLRRAHVGMKTVKNIINYIRQHNHTLDPDKVHLVGLVIWLRDLVVEGGVVDPTSPNQTIFLKWNDLVQSAENDFNKYSIAA